jgi:hypothetical protein
VRAAAGVALALLVAAPSPALASPAEENPGEIPASAPASSALTGPSGSTDRDPPSITDGLVISAPILAYSSNAFAVMGELPVAPHLSVSVGVGGSDSADGDYQAFTGSLGSELRVWLQREPRGLFAAPRVEASLTRLARGDRTIGYAWTVAEGVVGGYRLVLFDHVEITPVLGLLFMHDLGAGRLPAQSRGTLTGSLQIGWAF